MFVYKNIFPYQLFVYKLSQLISCLFTISHTFKLFIYIYLISCLFTISEVYYRAGITPKQYQHELERQLRKTTLGISFGLVKSFSAEKQTIFEPYGHFGQSFQQLELDNNISQYKICEVKPPSLEKFLDTDGHSLDLSAPPFTIPGGHMGPFDTRNAAFGRDIFPALFLFPEQEETMSEKDQYYVRSLIANALLRNSGGSSKFSVAEISTWVLQSWKKGFATLRFLRTPSPQSKCS